MKFVDCSKDYRPKRSHHYSSQSFYYTRPIYRSPHAPYIQESPRTKRFSGCPSFLETHRPRCHSPEICPFYRLSDDRSVRPGFMAECWLSARLLVSGRCVSYNTELLKANQISTFAILQNVRSRRFKAEEVALVMKVLAGMNLIFTSLEIGLHYEMNPEPARRKAW